jgi:hypothetical protein
MSYPGITSDFNLSADLPPDIAIEAQRLNRRQKIADLLIASSLHPIQAGESKGRFQAPISWAQGLAQLGEAGAGAYISHRNDVGARELGARAREADTTDREAAREAIRKAMMPTPAVPGTPDIPGAPSNLQDVIAAVHAQGSPDMGLQRPSAGAVPLDLGAPQTPPPSFNDFLRTSGGQPGDFAAWQQDNPANKDPWHNPNAPPEPPAPTDLRSLTPPEATQGVVPPDYRPPGPVTQGTPGTPEIPAPQAQVTAVINDLMMSKNPAVRHYADFMSKQAQHQEDQKQKAAELVARREDTQLLRQQTYDIQKGGLDEKVATRIQRGDELAARAVDMRLTETERAAARKEQNANMNQLKQLQLDQMKLSEKHQDENRKAEIQLRRDLEKDKAAERKDKEGKLTESQANANIYATRGREAHKILMETDKSGAYLEDRINVAGLAAKQGAEGVPLVGGALGAIGNTMLSPDQQRVEQAQRNFINAALRKESGATIQPSEFREARKQYFPQPGDSKEVIEQKRQNRETEIRGLEIAAGPAAKLSAAAAAIAAAGAAPKAPAAGPFKDPDKERRYQEWKKSQQP